VECHLSLAVNVSDALKGDVCGPPRPCSELMVTVYPIGNCVCGLKEPLVLCANARGIVARSPAKAKSRIPFVVDFVEKVKEYLQNRRMMHRDRRYGRT
jgi:hypothetical protein